MTPIELVKFFKQWHSIKEFCLENGLDQNSECIEIFMETPFANNKELFFIEVEKTAGAGSYSFQGKDLKTFSNLFLLLEFLRDWPKYHRDPTLAELSEEWVSYVVNDA